MRQRLAFGALGLGDAVADLPEGLGLRFARSDHRIADDALLKRNAEQPLELAIDVHVGVGRGRFNQRVPGVLARQRRPCARNVLEHQLERVRGTSSKPSMLWVRASRKRSRSSARIGLSTPAQATARAATAGTRRSATAVITPSVPFCADQQLVDAVSAIVLLETR